MLQMLVITVKYVRGLSGIHGQQTLLMGLIRKHPIPVFQYFIQLHILFNKLSIILCADTTMCLNIYLGIRILL